MGDAADNLVLTLVRAIRADVAEIKTDLLEIKEPLGFLEARYASLSRQLDCMDADLGRIKVRLGLVDETVP